LTFAFYEIKYGSKEKPMSRIPAPPKIRRDGEDAERIKREEENRRRERDEEDRRIRNMAMGDMLNTGIPGGIDMDITTPL
jgi:hypothetical protein